MAPSKASSEEDPLGNEKLKIEERFEGGKWNADLESIQKLNLYNSWSWGEYKSRNGWKIRRLAIIEGASQQLLGLVQIQEKKNLPGTVYLIQGGVQITKASDDLWVDVFTSILQKELKLGLFDLILVNYHGNGIDQDYQGLLRFGFFPVLTHRMYTFALNLDDESLEKKLSHNWRHNLKRAQKNPALSIDFCVDNKDRVDALRELDIMYAKLRARKLFDESVDIKGIQDLVIQDQRFVVVKASLDGCVIGVRVGFQASDHMLDFLAASAETAKNTYANYLLLWSLIDRARSLGLRSFDCGGIDPHNNLGVYNFKKGMNGKLSLVGPLWVYNKNSKVKSVMAAILAGFF
jgi:hypothetical protein